MLRRGGVECGEVWCGEVWCGEVWCGEVWCGEVWWFPPILPVCRGVVQVVQEVVNAKDGRPSNYVQETQSSICTIL